MDSYKPTLREIRDAARSAAESHNRLSNLLSAYIESEEQSAHAPLPQAAPVQPQHQQPQPQQQPVYSHPVQQRHDVQQQAQQQLVQQPRPVGQQQRPIPQQPHPSGQPLPTYGQPSPVGAASNKNIPRTPLQQWWQQEESVTKVLAVVGGLVTLIGLVFLATLAYNTGILGPESSVILAAVACVIIFGLAFFAHGKQPRGATAPSLVVVAILGGLADLWVAIFKLGWLTEITGAVLTAVLSMVGLGVAYQWNQEKLAVIVTALSPLFITPVFLNLISDSGAIPSTSNMAFPGCVCATALAAFAVRWGRAWPALHTAASVTFAIGILLTWDNPVWACMFSGLGVALLILFAYDQPAVPRPLTVCAWIAFLVFPIVAVGEFSVLLAAFEAVVFGVVLIWAFSQHGSALLPPARPVNGNPNAPMVSPNTPLADNACAGVYCSAVALGLALLAAHTHTHQSIFACAAIALCGLIIVLFPRVHPIATNTAAVVAFLIAMNYGGMLLLDSSLPLDDGLHLLDIWSLPALCALVLGLFLYVRRGTYGEHTSLPLVCSVCALLMTSAAIVGAVQFITLGEPGFMVGHMIISIGWIVVSLFLMSRPGENWTKLGLILTLAAVAKLVLFDLSILGGLVQVLAFIISGALLLIAAFQRERFFGKKPPPQNVHNAPNLHNGPQHQQSQQGSPHNCHPQNPYPHHPTDFNQSPPPHS